MNALNPYETAIVRNADWILGTQDEKGGFSNFQAPDDSFPPLRSGNVNYYACIALWLYNEVYNNGRNHLSTADRQESF